MNGQEIAEDCEGFHVLPNGIYYWDISLSPDEHSVTWNGSAGRQMDAIDGIIEAAQKGEA